MIGRHCILRLNVEMISPSNVAGWRRHRTRRPLRPGSLSHDVLQGRQGTPLWSVGILGIDPHRNRTVHDLYQRSLRT